MPTRKPQAPPPLEALLREAGGVADLLALVDLMREQQGAATYLHWDELRHRPPPEGLSTRQWWLVQKLARRGTPLPLVGTNGKPFTFCQPSLLLKGLHDIDMTAGGNVLAPEAVTNPHTRDRYLISTLMEEAITSSQMEGAATTRDVAKDMIRSGRRPRDRSERMILNNYRTMQRIRVSSDIRFWSSGDTKTGPVDGLLMEALRRPLDRCFIGGCRVVVGGGGINAA